MTRRINSTNTGEWRQEFASSLESIRSPTTVSTSPAAERISQKTGTQAAMQARKRPLRQHTTRRRKLRKRSMQRPRSSQRTSIRHSKLWTTCDRSFLRRSQLQMKVQKSIKFWNNCQHPKKFQRLSANMSIAEKLTTYPQLTPRTGASRTGHNQAVA